MTICSPFLAPAIFLVCGVISDIYVVFTYTYIHTYLLTMGYCKSWSKVSVHQGVGCTRRAPMNYIYGQMHFLRMSLEQDRRGSRGHHERSQPVARSGSSRWRPAGVDSDAIQFTLFFCATISQYNTGTAMNCGTDGRKSCLSVPVVTTGGRVLFLDATNVRLSVVLSVVLWFLSVRLSMGPSRTIVRFAANKDQHVSGRSVCRCALHCVPKKNM